jgi:hypothetical protein
MSLAASERCPSPARCPILSSMTVKTLRSFESPDFRGAWLELRRGPPGGGDLERGDVDLGDVDGGETGLEAAGGEVGELERTSAHGSTVAQLGVGMGVARSSSGVVSWDATAEEAGVGLPMMDSGGRMLNI